MFCHLFYAQSNLGVKMTHGRKPLQSERGVLRKRKDDLMRTSQEAFMQSRKTGFADLTGGFPQRRIYSADIRKAFRREEG